jgi:hypothetical protein
MQLYQVHANSNDVIERRNWAKSILLDARTVAKSYILEDMQHPEHDAGDLDIARFVETGFDEMSSLQIRDYIESLEERGSYNQYEDPGPNANDTSWIRAMRAAYIIVWADGNF